MSKLIDAGKEVLGTGREAKENFNYDQLVKKYDKHTADMLISKQLEAGDITLGEFDTYKKVRRFVHNGGLNVAKAVDEAEKDAASTSEIQEILAC
ncbi:hypothetical protein K0I73_15530 [Shewanella mesophila]|uniref:hypothetical protein n=1 Tax=Shewanella mesophila TaxID=2864208 RepID=UPI001C660F17|nr:hypothetical protein [Shewanella mesophila]QYJ85583.1 hypothetical protein K0I73_15530 [Shewanella mesophila]